MPLPASDRGLLHVGYAPTWKLSAVSGREMCAQCVAPVDSYQYGDFQRVLKFIASRTSEPTDKEY